MNASQTNSVTTILFLYSPIMSDLLPILAISSNNGTAAIALNTAVKTNALIGSIPIKLNDSPITVAINITT